MFNVTLKITPVPLARPRVTARGTFLPKRSQQFRDDFRVLARAAFKREPYNSPIVVTIHFYKPLKIDSTRYGDIDNLVKAVLDAGNGLLWADDSQIIELHAYKHKGAGKIELEVIENVG